MTAPTISRQRGCEQEFMSWQYIAGFLDGDGYATSGTSYGKRGGIHNNYATIAFCNTNRAVLEEIQAFIQAGRFYRNKDSPRAKIKSTKICWQLVIGKFEETIRIGKSMLPYLRIKQENVRYVVDRAERLLAAHLARRKMPILSKAELYDLHWNQGKTTGDIARMYGVHHKTVYIRFKRFGIPLRPMENPFVILNRRRREIMEKAVATYRGRFNWDKITKEQLVELYWDCNLSFSILGRIFNRDPTTIQERFVKLGIATRAPYKSIDPILVIR